MEIVFDKINVVRNNGTAFQKTILKDFCLEIKSREINGICGGMGKSTIGKLMCALENITSGELRIGDFVLNKRKYQNNINELRFQIGYLYSNPADFLYNRTVKEEIEFGLKYYKYKLEILENRVKDALKIVGLDDTYLNRNPRELSYVESKKVMLAAVLVFNPRVIILDDFEKGLNRNDRDYFKRLFINLKKRFNKTIIVITNDVEFMFDFCDNVSVIQDGKLVLSGDKSIFFDLELYDYVEIPKIIEFVRYAESKNHKLGNYTDIKDLLKAVYREHE